TTFTDARRPRACSIACFGSRRPAWWRTTGSCATTIGCYSSSDGARCRQPVAPCWSTKMPQASWKFAIAINWGAGRRSPRPVPRRRRPRRRRSRHAHADLAGRPGGRMPIIPGAAPQPGPPCRCGSSAQHGAPGWQPIHTSRLIPFEGTFLLSEDRGHFYFALTTMKTTLVMALTLMALCVPRTSTAQQMNFSYYSSYYVSNDGSTLYTVVDGSDNSTGCTHVNYQTTAYVNGPTGNAMQTTVGLYGTVSVPYGGGNFGFWSDLVLDCSCFGPSLDGGGGASAVSLPPVPTGEYSIPNA